MGSDKPDLRSNDEQKKKSTVAQATSRRHVVIGVSAIAAGLSVVALHQGTRTVASKGHLAFYTNPLTGFVCRLCLGGSVKSVLLSDAALRSVPSVLLSGSFHHVRSLNLSDNPLCHLPERISQLRNLSKLVVSNCQLEEVPQSIGEFSGLIDLDIGRNRLTHIPSTIGNLTSLKYLNVMSNCIVELPDEIGNLSALYRLGLKGNQLSCLPESFGGLVGLVELFITDNKLVALPSSMGQLTNLVKLQASFNQLQSLPPEIGSLPKLELMRVAVNEIAAIPESFTELQSLAWFSLAGNPVCPPPRPPTHKIEQVHLSDLDIGPYLGCGASGEVFKSMWRGQAVAVKLFKADVSPDGRAKDEIDIALFVDHANLTKVIASVDRPHALVKELVLGKSMADKPNFVSLLRCRWAPGLSFRLRFVLRVAGCVARALRYMHSHGICHGDVYAHNVLADEDGNAVLCDYGAAFFYDTSTVVGWEAMEVRAFGLFLKDLVDRLQFDVDANVKHQLMIMVHMCVNSSPGKRPSFDALCRDLDALLGLRNVM